MVKIVEVEDQHDAGSDDDCCEISLEEFAKKVTLKEDDDLILVAAKGKIVKVEADQSEDPATAYDDYGTDTEAESSCNLGSGGRGQQAAPASAAGDCVDNPHKIDEDEPSLLKVKIEDIFVIGKHSVGCDKKERSCNAANVIPGVLVPVVKSEPVGDNGVEAAEDSSYDHCHEKRIFDEDDEDDVVVV